MFRTSSVPIIRSYLLYTRQLVRFLQVMWPLPSRVRMERSSILTLLGSGHEEPAWNLPVAQCTVDNSWWWAQKMSETCRVLWQNKFWMFNASSWLFYTRLITMHGHILNIDATCRWVGQFHDQATLFPMRILLYPLYGRISGRFGPCRRWKIPAAAGNWYCFFVSQPSTVRLEQMWTACKRAWEAWR